VIRSFAPTEPAAAARVVEIQRAAYQLEAELMGFDGIPTLHESAHDVQTADLHWLGSYAQSRLVGVIAWQLEDGTLVIDRLAVDPSFVRQGRGRSLVAALPPADRIAVSTGTANAPARSLYEGLGFVSCGELEVAPGITVTKYQRTHEPAAESV
jgi:ribosomal protein S18 acetylase RimI-like enzyme